MKLILTIPESRLNPPPIRNANQLKTLATPPGFEPATFSLEECWETQSFQCELQLFGSQKWSKFAEKLQLAELLCKHRRFWRTRCPVALATPRSPEFPGLGNRLN
jgi:hypothetical protein